MRNDIRSYFKVALAGLLLFLLQISIFNTIPWFNIPINFLFVYSLCLSSFAGVSQRIVISLYCGLLIDLWFSSCSFYTISLLIVNSLIAFVSSQTRLDNFFIFIAATTGTLLIELINAAFLGFCLYNTPFNPLLIYHNYILRLLIGNTVFALLIFPIIKRQFFVKSSFSRY
jgi:hypothetical protein